MAFSEYLNFNQVDWTLTIFASLLQIYHEIILPSPSKNNGCFKILRIEVWEVWERNDILIKERDKKGRSYVTIEYFWQLIESGSSQWNFATLSDFA